MNMTPWPNVRNILQTLFTNVCNKLECLFLAGFPNPVLCLGVRSGAYPRMEQLKGATLGLALVLPANVRLEKLAKNKHLIISLITTVKSCITCGPRPHL